MASGALSSAPCRRTAILKIRPMRRLSKPSPTVSCPTCRKFSGGIWVVIRIEELPDEETIRIMDLGSPYNLLGLYRGIDVGHKEQSGVAPLNDTIFLYRQSILLYRLETGQPLNAVVQHVLIHEIGHHFGLSDDDMDRIERSAD